MPRIYWTIIRGLVVGVLGGALVVLLLMWSADDIDEWRTRTGAIALTIVLFGAAGIIGGVFMGRDSR